jgi:hypothetical protein
MVFDVRQDKYESNLYALIFEDEAFADNLKAAFHTI